MKHQTLHSFLVVSVLFLVGCGSGGDNNNPQVNKTEVHAAASIGDLVSYTLTPGSTPNSYNYTFTIVESDFGLTGTTQSGTLTQNADNTYTPSSSPNARVLVMKNDSGDVRFVVGKAALDTPATDVLFAGVTATAAGYNLASVAGVYNFVSYQCDAPLSSGACSAGYSSRYGTFKIDAAGTFTYCEGGNLAGNAPTCSATVNGTLADNGNGTLTATIGSDTIAKAMILPGSNGNSGSVLVVDLKNHANGGPGILVGVKQTSLAAVDVGGTYWYHNTSGGSGAISVDNTTDSFSGDAIGSFTRDTPWSGMIQTSGAEIGAFLPDEKIFIGTGGSNIIIGGRP